MDNRNIDQYRHVLKERQVELAFELQKAVWLLDPDRPTGGRRRLLLSLATTILLVAVIVAASVHLLM